MWEYSLIDRWIELGNYEVTFEDRDIKIVVDGRGVEHTLLRGQALERQRERTPEPRKTEPKVETVAPITPDPIPSTPEIVDEPVDEELTAVLDTEPELESEPAENFQPDSEDWFLTTVIRNDADEDFLFAVLDNDERVFIHEREIRPFGCHYCPTVLPFGSAVEVRIERSKSKGATYTALEARIKGHNPNGNEIFTARPLDGYVWIASEAVWVC